MYLEYGFYDMYDVTYEYLVHRVHTQELVDFQHKAEPGNCKLRIPSEKFSVLRGRNGTQKICFESLITSRKNLRLLVRPDSVFR